MGITKAQPPRPVLPLGSEAVRDIEAAISLLKD